MEQGPQHQAGIIPERRARRYRCGPRSCAGLRFARRRPRIRRPGASPAAAAKGQRSRSGRRETRRAGCVRWTRNVRGASTGRAGVTRASRAVGCGCA
ncbi:Hypothetical protein I596_658 [Dokdonella koreensis DS-123]|uniref:Uncharacterized protein n=1 Tax=Dokdonella koreensis DS-123 TaxID=1300342 RepID=A0A167GLG7_9GAMM|nr:Hypothetical protein I596_658 [Dokdonella koreensis DS-123]